MTDPIKPAPCPACPDGNEWDCNSPTGRVCRVCGGHAVLNLDGSRVDPTTADDEWRTEYEY